MQRHKLRFTQIIGGLSKIEGAVASGDNGVNFELAMTESIEGPVKGIIKRSVQYVDLEDVEYTRRFLRAPILKFTVSSLSAFESIPGSTGFEYVVSPVGNKEKIRSFVTDVRLAIAEATTERFTHQIKQSESE